MRGTVAATALAAAVLALAAPAAAGAAQAVGAASAAFTIRGSYGFRLDVESQAGAVTVVASERRPPVAGFAPSGRLRPADTGNGASSIYYARAAAPGPERVEATLGALGRIAVSFHPSGAVRVTELRGGAGCERRARIVRRLGTFTGLVEFRGEDGYTAVRATSAAGSVGTPLPRGCATAAAAPARTVVLAAANRRAGTSFEAKTTRMGVAFLATLRERLDGGLVVLRRAYAGAPSRSFSFDDALASARVTPPAPFTGSARYLAGAGPGGSWTGTLEATFPGATLPMTGPGFRARLGAR
ncbi:MAG TPA: hypothetical protein VHA54_08605 [Solirubrobacterales bacterium]|nr:hypothetical protein [Solirubrobacterales bacterium]